MTQTETNSGPRVLASGLADRNSPPIRLYATVEDKKVAEGDDKEKAAKIKYDTIILPPRGRENIKHPELLGVLPKNIRLL